MSRPNREGSYTPVEVAAFTEGRPFTVCGHCAYCEHALYIQFGHECSPTNAHNGAAVDGSLRQKKIDEWGLYMERHEQKFRSNLELVTLKCPSCGFWVKTSQAQAARVKGHFPCPCPDVSCRTFVATEAVMAEWTKS
jgi:hypothetical protein